MDYVWFILLGHIFGDYFTQPAYLAFSKKEKTLEGLLCCLVHSTIYSILVCLIMFIYTTRFNSMSFILILISHFIVDRYSIIDLYCKIIRIRTWKSHIDLDNIESYLTKLEGIHLSFGVLVYVIIDNTIHILTNILIFKLYNII